MDSSPAHHIYVMRAGTLVDPSCSALYLWLLYLPYDEERGFIGDGGILAIPCRPTRESLRFVFAQFCMSAHISQDAHSYLWDALKRAQVTSSFMTNEEVVQGLGGFPMYDHFTIPSFGDTRLRTAEELDTLATRVLEPCLVRYANISPTHIK